MTPVDHEVRTQFIEETERSIALIAPAGVGKTHSIVERVLRLASGEPEAAADRLRRLVVVTYTRRAAREMKRRALERLANSDTGPEVRRAMQEAFFGTIHSFCLRLLQRHGHHAGLPPMLQTLDKRSRRRLWTQFRLAAPEIDRIFADAEAMGLLRLLHLRAMLGSVDQETCYPMVPAPAAQIPIPDVTPILEVVAKGNGKPNIEKCQADALAWVESRAAGGFSALPKMSGTSKAMEPSWNQAFAPCQEWIDKASAHIVSRLESAFARFRQQQGFATFDDQVRLAFDLVGHETAGPAVNSERSIVILDEAQDTDQMQFDVLMAAGGVGEEAGRFCMVGDFQQAIFGSRTHPGAYRRAYEKLEAAGGISLPLRVTFRCPSLVVDTANAIFVRVFDGANGQAKHAPLEAKNGADAGEVTVLELEDDGLGRTRLGDVERAASARFAAWLTHMGTAGMGVDRWGDIALLTRTRAQCATLENALLSAGIPAQRAGNRALREDLAAYRWSAGLLKIAVEPSNAYEIAGVLREIFGLSDGAIYQHLREANRTLDLIEPDTGNGVLAEALRDLAGAVRAFNKEQPLFSKVRALFHAIDLRGRLAALPAIDSGDPALDLELLLAEAADAETRKLMPRQLVEQWVDAFELEAPAEESKPDAVQIFTLHKAKGLEWPVVILPFLGRTNSSGKTNKNQDAEPGEDDEDEGGRQSPEERLRELARLWYVGMTRAKQRLYFVDDSALMAGIKKASSRSRFIDIMEHDAEASEVWKGLKRASIAKDLKPLETYNFSLASQIAALHVPALAPGWHDFVLRRTPHRLAIYPIEEKATEKEIDRDDALVSIPSAISEAAFLYGNWWHQGCENTPWYEPPATWEKVWTAWLISCPEPERGAAAWKRFINGPLAARIAGLAGWNFRCEVAFFVRDDEPATDAVLDGLVDFLALSPDGNEAIVLDWKTNRDTRNLAVSYGGQVQAYMRAFGAFFITPVSGLIYATESGEVLTL